VKTGKIEIHMWSDLSHIYSSLTMIQFLRNLIHFSLQNFCGRCKPVHI